MYRSNAKEIIAPNAIAQELIKYSEDPNCKILLIDNELFNFQLIFEPKTFKMLVKCSSSSVSLLEETPVEYNWLQIVKFFIPQVKELKNAN